MMSFLRTLCVIVCLVIFDGDFVSAGSADVMTLTRITVPGPTRIGVVEDKSITQQDLKDLNAYRWSLGKRNGVLITAVLTSGANECVVVSVKKGGWKIIGSSPLRHPCFWSELPPVIDQGAGQYEIKFMSQQDYIGTGVQFTPSSVDLTYVKKNADFCMVDIPGPGCVKY